MSPLARKESNPISRLDPATLPIGEAAQTFLAGLAQVQSEAAQLTCRRARAWIELPQAMSVCRSFPDVAETQARFVQAFWTDWLQAGQRMASSWSKAMAAPVHAVGEAVPEVRSPDISQASDPFAVWEWWRTDLKAIVPRRNESAPVPGNRSGTH